MRIMNKNRPPVALSVMGLLCCLLPGALFADVEYDQKKPPLAFAAQELEAALKESGSQIRVTLSVELDEQSPDAFELKINGSEVLVVGTDASGAMYGGLEVAECLKLGLPIVNKVQKPYVEKRGIKFNIPLDARTPSYDDTGDSAQVNIETIWDFEFWKAYLDDLARYRYNVLSLWNVHPYANLVKLADYPEAINEDVYRIKDGVFKPEDKSRLQDVDQNGDGYLSLEHDSAVLELVKKMTIDEKIAHWKKVFQYAEDRGIEVFLFSWNVFVCGATDKHGIIEEQTNETTIDYVRKSVAEALRLYPQISGIGVCAGENDRRELDGTPQSCEHYIYKTFGRAIEDVKKEQPEREVRFIHRRHGSKHRWVNDAFKNYTGGELDTSLKYAVAHIYSSRRPQEWESRIVGEGWLEEGFNAWLNLRNDDIFMHRWGSPDFVRDFLRWMPKKEEGSPGFMMGSDGYVWAREFISKNPAISGQLEIVKHWYRFRLWGQLAYNPDLNDDYWLAVLRHRFPGIDEKALFDSWNSVSEIIPQLNRSVWAENDAMFAAEGCMARAGFLTTDEYHFKRPAMALNRIKNAPDPQCLTVTEWAQAVQSGKSTFDEFTPLQIADNLDAYAQAAEDAMQKLLNQPPDNEELKETLLDIQSMAHLGHYYASKMRGAAHLALFRESEGSNQEAHQQAVNAFRNAVGHWEAYANVLDSHYRTSLTARTRHLDWNATLNDVRAELAKVEAEGDRPEVAFVNLKDGARFPVGTDLDVAVTASDKDGVKNVRLYINGLLLNPEQTGEIAQTWKAAGNGDLKNMQEGFYEVKAVAVDQNNVFGKTVAHIQVGNPSPDTKDKWKNEIHQVFLEDGAILQSDKGESYTLKIPRLECFLSFNEKGMLTVTDQSGAQNEVLFKAISKTKPGRHHAVLKKGVLTIYTGWPGDKENHKNWRYGGTKEGGPYHFGITRNKKVVCFTEENGEVQVVWWRKPFWFY